MRRNLLVAAVLGLAGSAILAVSPLIGTLDAGADAGTSRADRTPSEQPTAALDTHLAESAWQAAMAAWALQLEQEAAAAAAAFSSEARGSSGGTLCGADFECFKECTLQIESGGNYGAVSSSGTYRGAYQYDQQTWDSNAEAAGRSDLVGQDPAAADPAAQDEVAQYTYSTRGNQPWGGRC